MNCPTCYAEYQVGDRLIGNKMETFVFKPATVEDVKVFTLDKAGNRREISAAATMSPEELRELRKEHRKSEVATVFVQYKGEVPEGLFNVRHAFCAVRKTATNPNHPMLKHAIRYQRGVKR